MTTPNQTSVTIVASGRRWGKTAKAKAIAQKRLARGDHVHLAGPTAGQIECLNGTCPAESLVRRP